MVLAAAAAPSTMAAIEHKQPTCTSALGPWAAAQASLLSKIACLQIRRIKKLRSSQLRHASSRRYQARDKLGRNLTSQRSASASSPRGPPSGPSRPFGPFRPVRPPGLAPSRSSSPPPGVLPPPLGLERSSGACPPYLPSAKVVFSKGNTVSYRWCSRQTL